MRRCCSTTAFKLASSAENSRHRLDGATGLGRLIAGVRFRDGEAVTKPEEQAAARRHTPSSCIARGKISRRVEGRHESTYGTTWT